MTKKIFRSTVAVGLAVLLASLVIIMGALYTYFGHVQEQQLRDELSIAAAAMESGDGEAYLSKLHSDNYRITGFAPTARCSMIRRLTLRLWRTTPSARRSVRP